MGAGICPWGRRSRGDARVGVGAGLRWAPLLLLACQGPGKETGQEDACALGERRQQWTAFCPSGADLLPWVDPMIGTQGSGNAVPGPQVPHGFVKLSPDSLVGAGSIDAYEYDAERLEGFSHTHLEGPGGSFNGYSQVLLLPTTGPLPAAVEDLASSFSHDSEQAAVGYYGVTLDDYGVRAELTATAHAGVHRYTFPASDEAHILLDAGHSRGDSLGGEVLVDPAVGLLEGYGQYNMHPLVAAVMEQLDQPTTGEITVYFSALFSRPFTSWGTFSRDGGVLLQRPGEQQVQGAWSGAWAGFATDAGEAIEVRVGISLVSVAQARASRVAEADGRSFEALRASAEAAWACMLGRVQVEGGSDEERTLFYTALYRAMMQPSDLVEPSGQFVSATGGEPEVFQACEERHFYADDWCLWDTFRTTHPLATLTQPETMDDRVGSFLHQYQQGGWLPKCTWAASGYSRVMIGNHAVPVLADAVAKGFSDFDTDLLWQAVNKTSTSYDPDSLMEGFCGYFDLGTPPDYLDLGYVSHECDPSQSASMTLEQAYDDWAAAQLAARLGLPAEAQVFMGRAANWRNHWDPELGFMRGKQRDGSWVEPFEPDGGTDFCEATSWIYSFFVPHDVPALVEAMGGDQAFIQRLDAFFDEGHFEPDNEPSFHIPFLYNYTSAPERTQERVGDLLASAFAAEPGGLPGNDDAGATSALYALAAMGLYPVAPGDGRYQITTPLFQRVELWLHPALGGGESFVIQAERPNGDERFIHAATLEGVPLEVLEINHAQVVAGGTLVLELAR